MNLSSFSAAIHRIFSSAPTVIDEADGVVNSVLSLIQQAEGIPGASGAAKLAHVHDELASMWGGFKSIVVEFEAAWPQIESTVSALVELLTLFGALKAHKA